MPNDYEKRVALLKSRASATDLLVIEAVEKAAAEITATAAVVKALREELTLEGGIEKAFRLGNSRGGVQSRGADAISKALAPDPEATKLAKARHDADDSKAVEKARIIKDTGHDLTAAIRKVCELEG